MCQLWKYNQNGTGIHGGSDSSFKGKLKPDTHVDRLGTKTKLPLKKNSHLLPQAANQEGNYKPCVKNFYSHHTKYFYYLNIEITFQKHGYNIEKARKFFGM